MNGADARHYAESRAISKYIIHKYGKNSTLVPPASDLEATAKYDAAVSIEQADFDKFASDLVFELVFKACVQFRVGLQSC